MSRTVSTQMLAALYAQETSEILVSLITITHPNLATPLRFSNWAQPGAAPTVSRGISFLFFPFDVEWPLDRPDQPPRARLVADVVDRAVIAAIRAVPVTSPATLVLELVLASLPSNVEWSSTFTVRHVEYDVFQLAAELDYDLFLSESYPGDNWDPATAPGIFE